MITRKLLFIDRLAGALLALLLLAGGVLGVWWWLGDRPFTGRTDTSGVDHVVAMSWWPWVSVVVGVALVVVGLRWVSAHLRLTRVNQLYLEGSGGRGLLVADTSKVVGAAAAAYAGTLGVRSARGSVRRVRGQVVATIEATVEQEADLEVVAAQADLVAAQLAGALGRDDVRCSVQLTVARRGSSTPLVR